MMTDTARPDPADESAPVDPTDGPTAREPTELDHPTGEQQAAENTENEPAG